MAKTSKNGVGRRGFLKRAAAGAAAGTLGLVASPQAALAQEEGIIPLLLENGDVLQFGPGSPAVVDSIPTGRLAVDGDRIVPLKGGVLSARRRMLFNGVVVGSFVTDGAGKRISAAKVSAPGLLDEADGRLKLDIEAEFLDNSSMA